MEVGPQAEVVAAARGELEAAEAREALTQVDLLRSNGLRERNALSNQEFDQALYRQREAAAEARVARARLEELVAGTRAEQVESQKARVRQLEAQINTLEVQIDKAVLRVPFGGTIAARLADEGLVLTAGAPVVELMETEPLDVRVGFTGEPFDRVTVGTPLTVRIRGR